MNNKFIKICVLSIGILVFAPKLVFAAGFREGLGVTLGVAGAFIGLILGWIIFPFTLSFIDVIGKSPINLFFSRIGGAVLGAILGFIVVGNLFIVGSRAIDNSAKTFSQSVPMNVTPQSIPKNIAPEGIPENITPKSVPENITKDINIITEPSRVFSNKQIENTYIGYVHAMVNAINDGDFAKVTSFLSEGSSLWKSQIALVKNLTQKKIKEKVVDAHVVEINWISDKEIELKTKETIMVKYHSGRSYTKEYYWKYKATCLNGTILFSDINKWL